MGLLQRLFHNPLNIPIRTMRGVPHHRAKSLAEKLSVAQPEMVNVGYVVKSKTAESWKLRKEILNASRLDLDLAERSRNRTLRIGYEAVDSEGELVPDALTIWRAALHYQVYQHLFRVQAYFYPCVALDIQYDEGYPVCSGNILPADITMKKPKFRIVTPKGIFDDTKKAYYTLCLTSLDSHLTQPDKEYLHWMVANIDSRDMSSGLEMCSYLPPFMPYGAGYHRFVFLVYRHDAPIETKMINKGKDIILEERSFDTYEFYKKHQDSITPVGLAFFQGTWHDCVSSVFHKTLNMRIPHYEYVAPEEELPTPPKFPEDVAFNQFIDRYRDKRDLAEEVYTERLKTLDPFQEEPPPERFPHLHPIPNDVPTWLHAELIRKRNRVGKYVHLLRPSLYPRSDYQNPVMRAQQQDTIETEKLKQELLSQVK